MPTVLLRASGATNRDAAPRRYAVSLVSVVTVVSVLGAEGMVLGSVAKRLSAFAPGDNTGFRLPA